MTTQAPHRKDLYDANAIFGITPEQAYNYKKRYWRGELERAEQELPLLLKETEMELVELPDTPSPGNLAGWCFDKFYNSIAQKHNDKKLNCAKKINKLRDLLANKWHTAPKQVDIDRIKEDIKLTDLMARSGHHPINKTTRSTIYLCPFHSERSGSFHVFPDNRYHCFGCGADGSNIDYVMATNNVTFPQAIKELQNYL